MAKNAAKTQQETSKKGVKTFSTIKYAPALAPYWHSGVVARLASPYGLTEVTAGLAAVLQPGEYLVAVGQKRFAAGRDLDELVAAEFGIGDAVDVWMTESVRDLWTRNNRVRREIRGRVRRLVIEDGKRSWRGDSRDVFFAITLTEADVDQFGVEPIVILKEAEKPAASKGCQLAREAHRRQEERRANLRKPDTSQPRRGGKMSLLEVDGDVFRELMAEFA